MENRERDKMSKSDHSTSGGDINRNTSSRMSKDKSGSSAEFGQKIGRSENLSEPNSRTGNSSGSGMKSDSGGSSSSSEIGSSRSSRGSSGMSEPRSNDDSSGSDSGSRH